MQWFSFHAPQHPRNAIIKIKTPTPMRIFGGVVKSEIWMNAKYFSFQPAFVETPTPIKVAPIT